jgi:uncharacterized protein (DUF2249 family)
MSASTSAKAVLGTDRVNDVLARDERLVEVFVRHSAHFTKLRNRTMRKVMGRLVTVEDASRIAAVPVEALLHDLNEALGIATPVTVPEPERVTIPPASAPAVTHPNSAPVVEVDVREDLRAGREPLARIMAAVGALTDDEVLRVRAIFEPVPLFTLLAKRGFAHESVAHAPDDWSVWFWHDATRSSVSATEAAPQRDTPPANERGTTADGGTVWLDVRGLMPPEPLVRTLAALESLPDGHQLVQVNERVPQLLLPMLAERGYSCELDESRAERVLLRIWRPA